MLRVGDEAYRLCGESQLALTKRPNDHPKGPSLSVPKGVSTRRRKSIDTHQAAKWPPPSTTNRQRPASSPMERWPPPARKACTKPPSSSVMVFRARWPRSGRSRRAAWGASRTTRRSSERRLAEARADRVREARRDAHPVSWQCGGTTLVTAAQSAGEVKPGYVIGFNDKRVPAAREHRSPRRCAWAGIYRDMHIRDAHASGGIARVGRRRGHGPVRDVHRQRPRLRRRPGLQRAPLEDRREDLERLAAEIAG